MDKPIRVAQVIGMAVDGGVEACIMNLYQHIDRTKVQFDFLVESTSNIINKGLIESLGGKVVIIPSYKKPFKYMKALRKIFENNNYDIVHSNMNALSVFALEAAKKAGIKVRIAHSHSTTNKKEVLRNIAKNILKVFSKKYATHYFACSEKAGRWLFGDKAFEAERVHIINNAIDINRFAFNADIRKKIRKEYNIGNRLLVGHIGRFVTQKNHSFLIDIFNELHKLNENSVLLLIGGGPLESQIKDKVQKLGLNESVIFVGLQKKPEDFYQAMDCFVLPSLYEGLPVVGVEAQINGLPCFFSDNITREILINKNSYMISSKVSPKEWSSFIINRMSLYTSDRKETFKLFLNSTFDICHEAFKLTSLYLSLVCNDSFYCTSNCKKS